MPFRIPNDADKFAGSSQSSPDAVDFSILAAAAGLTGVISGCAASVTGTDMNVTIAVGRVIINGSEVAVAAGSVAIVSTTLDRYALISVSSAGVKTVTNGATTSPASFPEVPANHCALHMVWVPANDTAITSGQIVDKRMSIVRDDAHLAYIYF